MSHPSVWSHGKFFSSISSSSCRLTNQHRWFSRRNSLFRWTKKKRKRKCSSCLWHLIRINADAFVRIPHVFHIHTIHLWNPIPTCFCIRLSIQMTMSHYSQYDLMNNRLILHLYEKIKINIRNCPEKYHLLGRGTVVRHDQIVWE